jgi:trimeric autotransporter adhesin
MGSSSRFLAWLVAALFTVTGVQAATPDTLGYQGRLTNGGVAVNGNVTVTFRLYSVASGGNALWTEANSVAVANGLYSVILGQSTAFPGSLFTQPLWLGVSLNADPEMTPRQPLTSTPYSQRAKSADTANYASALSVTPTTCGTGQFAQGISAAGNAVGCAAASTGTVTTVTASAPLASSGGATPNLTLAACSSGQILKHNGSAWTCAADANAGGTVTSIAAGAGLTGGTITGAGTLAIDPTSAVLIGNYFKQGGNAFGTAAILGTTDSFPLALTVGSGGGLWIYPGGDPVAPTSPNVSAGFSGNAIASGISGATIAGGGYDGGNIARANSVTGNWGTVGGGRANKADSFGTVGGGDGNSAGSFSTVSGGKFNEASGGSNTVSGGEFNFAGGQDSTVSGGWSNHANGDESTVSGGSRNYANGVESTVAGGSWNVAQGDQSFAAGVRAKANHANAFVWGGDPNNDTVSQEAGDFVVYAPGGVRLYAGPLGAGGCSMFNGTSGWGCASDRALKQNIVAVDAKEMLSRVLTLPVSSWSFKASPEWRHVGPMAQDFMAAFHLGIDDKTISTMDEGGVALAAIQGLAQIVQEKDAEIAALKQRLAAVEQTQRAEIAALKRSLADLRAALETTATRSNPLALHQ